MIAIRARRVFDGERIVPDAETVLIDGSRIVGVAPSGMPLPDGCDVVDFPDATLLPGLIDTHVHLCGDGGHGALDRLPTFSAEEMTAVIEGSLRAHLASGVTTVRDLGDRSWAVIDWRDRNRGDTGMPSVLASGAPITSPGGHCWNMVGQARGVDELCRAVRCSTAPGGGVRGVRLGRWSESRSQSSTAWRSRCALRFVLIHHQPALPHRPIPHLPPLHLASPMAPPLFPCMVAPGPRRAAGTTRRRWWAVSA